MSVRRGWYITCDHCGDPAGISTESASGARRLALFEGFGRKRVDGRMHDLCESCIRKVVQESSKS